MVVALIYSTEWKGKGVDWGKAKGVVGRLWRQRGNNVPDFIKYLFNHWIELILFGVGIYLFYYNPPFSDLAPELIGIAVVVLILDYRNKQRQEAQLKAQLTRQLESGDSGFAKNVMRELREYGWLTEALKKADLSGADLTNATLLDAKYNTEPFRFKFGVKHQPTQWPEGFDPIAAGAISVDERE